MAALLPIGGARADALLDDDFLLSVTYSGVHVADLRMRFARQGNQIKGSMQIASRGITNWLTSYSGDLTSVAALERGQFVSRQFNAHYESRRYTRDVAITYDPAGNPAAVEVSKRDVAQDVQIPASLWKNTVDPLTAILRVRARASTPQLTSRETVPVFDGRSRYDIIIHPLTGIKADPVQLKLLIKPIASASKSSWLQGWKDDDGRWLEAQFQNGPLAVPLLVQTMGGEPSSTVKLEKDCSPPVSCS